METIARRIQWLRRHGVLPPCLNCSELAPEPQRNDDLTPFLLAAWRRSVDKPGPLQQRRYAERVVAWLETQKAGCGELSWGVPGNRCRRVREWIGERLVWWPRGVPQGQRVGVISSRLGRNLQRQQAWFAALRGTCRQLDPDHAVLVATEKTTTGPFLQRCSELFQIPLLRFQLPGPRRTVADWFPHRLRLPPYAKGTFDLTWPAWISPPLSAEPEGDARLRDRLVTAASDDVVILKMRRGGYIDQLVRRRLKEESGEPNGTISLAVSANLVPPHLADQLPGARQTVIGSQGFQNQFPASADVVDRVGTVLSLNQIAQTGYLVHCTRRSDGPWPDQTVEDYHNALISGRQDFDHSALGTLARIATQFRLLATGRTIRGGTPVVCFTAAKLCQLKRLRVFRAHRGRWDFEPYGLCIRQDWLEQHGVRPVRYGNTTLWNQLAESERPFYQLQRSGKTSQIDWSVEREWRHVGDLDLANVPQEAAFLFVPTVDEARWLSAHSRWSVVALDEPG